MKRTEKVSADWLSLVALPEVSEIEVGVFGSEGDAQHKGGAAMSLAALATIHEFGALIKDKAGNVVGEIPARSFIRAWFDENEERVHAFFASRLVKLGPAKWDLSLEQTALWIQAEIQRRIRRGIAPKLAKSTVDRKGSSKPLIDSGALLAGILAKVNGKQAQ